MVSKYINIPYYLKVFENYRGIKYVLKYYTSNIKNINN